MKNFYLFRHGETDWNIKKLPQGESDNPLNENGLRQAEECSNFLKNFELDIIYSSPLKRALKTAEIVAKKLNINVKICQDLKAPSLGIVEGKTKAELESIVGKDVLEQLHNCKSDEERRKFDEIMKWENMILFKNRLYNSLIDIFKNEIFDNIGIATHEKNIIELLKMYNYNELSPINNCEVVKIEVDDGNIRIIERIKRE
ncbi:MAG: histidine phosphatase family protein [Rickettsiales bacterium]|nr:histidine phosphatase family protein [Rickettsiales bacterium]